MALTSIGMSGLKADAQPLTAKQMNGPDAWANKKLWSALVGDRTHTRDKAALKALGVDGSVPLHQARINAGLVAANDNFPAAAEAVA